MFQLNGNNQQNYELIKEEFLSDLNSTGLLLQHKKSGARLAVISNDDENKVFSIGFRTPPYNDTGLQHIIEHSVLCGSRKYPVKDPFVELCKGSLNTFLNAMTYPDKTVYPVASCNMADFKNIMDVYMDAVFYPNIYSRREIFMQEGWHYALEDKDAPLEYNGVVYNEMKGVYSSPEDVLSRYTFASLFPDNAYFFESGGDPECIPKLTYEEFLDYHRKYYHPSNSYIYLYGDMDVNERLEYLNDAYLKDFEKQDKDTVIWLQRPFERRVEWVRKYAITEEEPLEDNTYMALSWVVGTSLDRELYLAMQILDYVLVSSTGGVLKDALIKAKLGLDVDSSYENSIYQPMYTITLRNSNVKQKEAFAQQVRKTLQELVHNGIDRDLILAGLNYYEFKYREADFGPYPKGLMYGLQIFDSWLYDGDAPFIHIAAGNTFKTLRAKYREGYFEGLIEKYLLGNPHSSLVVLEPAVGLTKEREEEVARELAQYRATLSDGELERLVEQTEALAVYQEEPSTQEELETIPMLTLEDMTRQTAPLYIDRRETGGVPLIFSEIFTNRINYILMSFNCKNVPEDLVPYIGLLSTVLGEMDTENYTYGQLSNAININSGGISTSASVYTNAKDLTKIDLCIEVKVKVLYENSKFAFDIAKELLLKTKFRDYARLKELIARIKSRLEAYMTNAGHSVAMLEATAQFSKAASYSNRIRGYAFYRLIAELDKNFEEKKEQIADRLYELIRLIIRKDNLKLSLTADKEGLSAAASYMEEFVSALDDNVKDFVTQNSLDESTPETADHSFHPMHVKLGLTSSSQVQYVARCGNYRKDGFEYTGALRVLKVIFAYEYLWLNIRVKGGAYGCMSGFSKNGDTYFVSYRDPNLAKTNQVYEGAAEYIRNFSISRRDMLKYIIGTIGEMDTPLNPSAKGNRSFTAYMCDVTEADLQAERDEVLSATVNDIRNLAPLIESAMKQNYFCTVGNEDAIRSEGALFDRTESLIG